MPEFIRNTPIQEPLDFKAWSQRFQDRQDQFIRGDNFVSLSFMGPVIINLLADLHVGHPSTDYKRIEQEADAIVRTANSFVIFAGDEIDNLFWNPGQMQEMEQTPEQIEYFRALLKYYSDNGKLLHRIGGDHDNWLMRAGFDLQREVVEKHWASVSTGPTYIEANVDEEQYRLHGAHQLPGHSMYNNAHPQMRSERFAGGRGADVIFSGHNHQKGHAEDHAYEWPGQPHLVHYVALGPYKQTDSWLEKKGFPQQSAKEMFGAAIKIHPGRKYVIYFEDILDANKRVKGKR